MVGSSLRLKREKRARILHEAADNSDEIAGSEFEPSVSNRYGLCRRLLARNHPGGGSSVAERSTTSRETHVRSVASARQVLRFVFGCPEGHRPRYGVTLGAQRAAIRCSGVHLIVAQRQLCATRASFDHGKRCPVVVTSSTGHADQAKSDAPTATVEDEARA